MIIDFHTHIFPDTLAVKTIPMLAQRSHTQPHTDGTAARAAGAHGGVWGGRQRGTAGSDGTPTV